MNSQTEKCNQLAELHSGKNAWIIPNPWDLSSAMILESLGFKGLATTSAGLAIALGKSDGEISLQDCLSHCELLASHTQIPINVDFENGFADDPEDVAKNITRLIETGIAGVSIEDYSRDDKVIYPQALAVERVQAASEAIKASGLNVQLTGRAENLLRGVANVENTLDRLKAYSNAGSDVLYSPGINKLDQITEFSQALNKPINVLAPFFASESLATLEAAGANRISLGGALCYAALGPLLSASKEMLGEGSFGWLSHLANGGEVAKLMAR